MTQIPNALDMAKEVIKKNPDCFIDDLYTQSVIALAMIDYAQACHKIYVSEYDKLFIESNLPPVFTDIINSHFNIKTI